MFADANEFIQERNGWFEVTAQDREQGGWDIVLRIDGTYFLPEDEKEEMIQHWKDRLLEFVRQESTHKGYKPKCWRLQ